ncbi:hypothetical protein C0Q70_14741 [Pomacea canaliculata]|uniref:Uncharacterized protein n=1 Tax=Pomacea canaliculata TaxID=400727 RepID=A0A2T7NSX0_POMCA|nr:hypothetical protein C0Q70_14741 [Pomacea canaliculata]
MPGYTRRGQKERTRTGGRTNTDYNRTDKKLFYPFPSPPTLILLHGPPSQVCQRGGCTEGRKSSTKSQAYPTHPEYKTHLTLDELTTHPVTRPHTRQGLHLRPPSFLSFPTPTLPCPSPLFPSSGSGTPARGCSTLKPSPGSFLAPQFALKDLPVGGEGKLQFVEDLFTYLFTYRALPLLGARARSPRGRRLVAVSPNSCLWSLVWSGVVPASRQWMCEFQKLEHFLQQETSCDLCGAPTIPVLCKQRLQAAFLHPLHVHRTLGHRTRTVSTPPPHPTPCLLLPPPRVALHGD